MDIMTALWKIPERIAIALAGIGVLSGTFLPGVAEAVYKKAPEEYRDVPVTDQQRPHVAIFRQPGNGV